MSIVATIRTRVRPLVLGLSRFYLRRVWSMDIGPGVKVSLRSSLDLSNPRGIHIGRDSVIAIGAIILAHNRYGHAMATRIGERCFIGAGSIIYPGVTIGDECVVAAGSIVIADIPPNSFVSGNPARIMEEGLLTRKGGARIGHVEPGASEANADADALVSQILKVDVSTLGDDADLREFPGWDSLTIMTLVSAIEERTGGALPTRDITKLHRLGTLRQAFQAHRKIG